MHACLLVMVDDDVVIYILVVAREFQTSNGMYV
jgi:hypothetical protein